MTWPAEDRRQTPRLEVPPLTEADRKRIVKEALSEWLDKKWGEFEGRVGRWSIHGFALMTFTVVVVLFLKVKGWI